MERLSVKLIYLSCEKTGHSQHPLSSVCVDNSCPNCELVCSSCESSHKGHKIISLRDFIKLAEDGSYASRSIGNAPALDRFKNIKADLMQTILSTKKNMKELMNRLDKLLVKFGEYEEELAKTAQPPEEFIYNPTDDVAVLNAQIKRAAKKLDLNAANKKYTDYILWFLEQENKRLKDSLAGLLTSADTLCSGLVTRIYEWHLLPKWSQTLKHPDMIVNPHGNLVLREVDQTGSYEAVILSEAQLNRSCSWRIRQQRPGSWIGLGVMSANTARNWRFDSINFKGEKGCVIGSDGRATSYSTGIIAGALFSFMNQFDTIKITYSKEKQEVRFGKDGSVEWCTIAVPAHEGPLHACVLMQSPGAV